MKRIFITAFISFSTLSFNPCQALEIETHEAINEHVARNTVAEFTLDTYLKIALGIQDGIADSLNDQDKTQKVWQWLSLGGRYEDAPPENTIRYRRSRNHFHDPTKSWDRAYYSGPFSFCSLGQCPESAILWAQGPQPINDLIYNPGGDWSWKKVREYYYTALSGKDYYSNNEVAPAKTQRDSYFAKTFRGVGQLMHLVQDMSVPSHVRNDLHFFYDYEAYVKDLQFRNSASFVSLLTSPVTFDPSILTLPSNSLAPIPIANIFDTDQYDGTTSTLAQTWGTAIGLAEYTNANFFSEDTIDSSEFPFPSRAVSSYNICKDTAPAFSRAQKRWYLSRTSCPQDSQGVVDHFLTKGLFTGLQTMVTGTQWDDKVYESYARNLMPRAVGYSAGLLKYFFRGKLAVSPVDDYSVKVYNFSDEPLNSGVLELYYDDEQDNRHWCGTLTVQSPITTGKDSGPISLVPMPPTNNKHPGRYLAVFKGILGGEEGAVVGSFGFDWWEEWDNGLNGNHPWIYINGSRYDLNKGNGKVENAVESGNLRKKNIRYAGSSKQQVNESYIGENYKNDQGQYCIGRYCVSNDFGWEFPIQVTNRTWLTLKIDKMSGPDLPSLNCTVYDYDSNITTYYENSPAAFQHVNLVFRVGDGTSRVLEFTVNGQQSEQNKWVDFPLGKIKSYYLFNILKQLGPVIEPVWLDHISVRQWMPLACDAPATDQVQEMEIDHISIFDAHSVDGTLYEFDNVLPPSATSSRLIIVP